VSAKIHITTEKNWICRQLADHLKDLQGFRVRVTVDPPRDAQITYFLTYLFREFYRPVGKSVGLFTHYEPGKHQRRYDQIASQLDHCIVLNDGHYEYLGHRIGYANVSRVHLPVMFKQKIPPLRVGWFHRSPPGYGRRKRTDLLEHVRGLEWVDLIQSNGSWSAEQLHAHMRSVDVFLTTSDHESGPSCLLEGLSLGKDIVIPQGVGLADEYADIPGVFLFKPGNKEGLRQALRAAYEPLRVKYEVVCRNTVENWRNDHAHIFERMLA